MNMHGRFQQASKRVLGGDLSSYLCWTRMQTEAGQGLEQIISRKEAERRAGEGLFFWGVGNAPAIAIRALSRCSVDVPVIFSVMKSRPKAVDVEPGAVVVWTKYVDHLGIERDLPEHVVVTSRRDSASGPKRRHFALMCFSDKPLELVSGTGFDHRAYRNAGPAGAPVGASQVTALLEPVRDYENCTYEVNMRATLTGSYWVKLTSPVPVAPHLSESSSIANSELHLWKAFAAAMRGGQPATREEQPDLLNAAWA